MHEPSLKYVISKALIGVVERGAPFMEERNLHKDIRIRTGELRNLSSSMYYNKGIIFDVSHADQQSMSTLEESQRN